MSGYTPRLPLSLGDEPNFQNIEDISGLVQQNLKNLVLTSPGERLMDGNFGVGIRRFLFEQNISSVYGDITARIEDQVLRYLPFLEIDNVIITPDSEDDNKIHIQIQYFVTPTSEQNILTLMVRR